MANAKRGVQKVAKGAKNIAKKGIDGIDVEAIKEKAEADRKEKVEALNKEKAQLQAELPTIKGLFAGVKKSKIETRIAEIDAELKSLR